MNVLVLGSGGREHALSWKIAQSPSVENLYIAPGNSGTSSEGTNLEVDLSDFDAVAALVKKHSIDMVVVGPEEPLVKGIRSYLLTQFPGLLIVGPDEKGAQLEGSKDFAKTFMNENKIPTAKYKSFESDQIEEAKSFIKSLNAPYVLKADGLAAGKGVVICKSEEEAFSVLHDMLIDQKFGEASKKVVIEEFLDGIEVSFFVLTDGKGYVLFPEAKDYKRIGERDTGPNTGGMGAISPVPFAKGSFLEKVKTKIIEPTLSGLENRGINYTGFIFFGLMKVNEEPYVIEYNVRMGDPESQVVIPRINNDFVGLLKAAATGNLANIKIEIDPQVMTTVVLVSEGYPGSYNKGKIIQIGDKLQEAIIFHAGTKTTDGTVKTNGGRVLSITGIGSEMQMALNNSYKQIRNISWDGMQYRRDIGFDL